METYYRSAELAFRDDGDGPGIVEGRMVPYNQWTEIRSALEGHFLERILPGALTKTLKERAGKMRVLFQHGMESIGKSPIAALEEVRDEEDGAYYRARLLPSTPALIVDGLRAGLYGTSIAMRLPIRYDTTQRPKRSEYNPDGLEERSVMEASVKELSIVTFPAYEGATASVRSLTDELIVARLMDDPHHLLELVRNQSEEAAPPHPEPDEEPTPEENRDEPEPVEAGRDTQPKPKKDWLSEKEVSPPWLLP